MLKYIITLCTIPFCIAAPNIVGSYVKLGLVQHFPTTSFFVQQVDTGVVDVFSNEYIEYMEDHVSIYEDERWVINGLRSFDQDGRFLKNCVKPSGEPLVYNSKDLDPALKEELKLKWPALTLTITEENLWELKYNSLGSCISENASSYFQEAIRMLDKYEMRIVLSNASIETGKIYTFHHFLDLITLALEGNRPYIKCTLAPSGFGQYLSEVQVCFNENHVLARCEHRPYAHQCNPNLPVMYPAAPRELFG